MNSLLMIFCALALLITVTAKREYKCDWNSYEHLCLVGNACIEGSSETISDHLIVFDPRTQKLKENERKGFADCDLHLRIRNMNNARWMFKLDQPNIPLKTGTFLELYIGSTNVLGCNHTVGDVRDTFKGDGFLQPRANDEPYWLFKIRKLESINYENYKLEDYMLQTLNGLPGDGIQFKYVNANGVAKNIPYKGDLDKNQLLLNIAITRGCDEWLVEGLKIDNWKIVDPRDAIGKEAELPCEKSSAHKMYIQRKGDKIETEAHSVFCAGNVWAFRNMSHPDQITHLGKEKFSVGCTRDFCKFCGGILEDICATCRKHTTVNCVPKCPNDLWYFGRGVVKSPLSCKEHPDNAKIGTWMAESNGVDVPVEMASCWVGRYPLSYEETTTSSSLVAASWIALITIEIVYNI